MRTTIEITDAQRAQLLELAARRSQKGFSHLVQEALDAYLKAENAREQARRRVRMLRATLDDRDADTLRRTTSKLRNSW